MPRSEARLPIHPEAIAITRQEIRSQGDDAYEMQAMLRLASEHPLLNHYITAKHKEYQKTHSVLFAQTYSSSALRIYDVISRSNTIENYDKKLTPDEINSHATNFDHMQVGSITDNDVIMWLTLSVPTCPPGEDPDKDGLNPALSRLMNRIYLSSRDVYTDVATRLNDTTSYASQKVGFVHGLYDGFMPFYRKEEAILLERQLKYPHFRAINAYDIYSQENS